jgi:hypothetical protein
MAVRIHLNLGIESDKAETPINAVLNISKLIS